MRILVVGGGSGGHVTPAVAVIQEIKSLEQRADIRFWTDRKFEKHARDILKNSDTDVSLSVVVAGKLRRYGHLSLWQHITMPSILLRNIGDFFSIAYGILQSVFRLILWRPKVVFSKGGYACLPVGIAARLLFIPIVIHDSDAHPGLTSRVLARYARRILTGAPLDNYSYPADRSEYVGIPVSPLFNVHYNKAEKQRARKEFGLDSTTPLVVVTGGGLGARRLNSSVMEILPKLKENYSVVIVSGSAQYHELREEIPENTTSLQLHEFISKGMDRLMATSDIVVTRAGATTLLELAALAKPTIIVPNKQLTGNHQVKNAEVYGDAGAAIVLDEGDLSGDSELLLRAIEKLISYPDEAQAMAQKFAKFARPDAARRVAEVILEVARG